MSDVMDILNERGFIDQVTSDVQFKTFMKSGPVTCYIGFDPTAPSLHVGSLIPIMALIHMKSNGHRPIGLIGGGTGCIGDPSGKTDKRKIMSLEDISVNVIKIKKQLSKIMIYNNEQFLLLNNMDWLRELNYISFIRDIGSNFSVNKMIKAESYKRRLNSKEGLSFIEFNYMILQAYDFSKLYEEHSCCVQMGGSDQWGNIVAGIELIRRRNKGIAFGITFPLITTSNGVKMGKTASGAVWLDPNMTSPYNYYQFWININDDDLEKFLAWFTFLPMKEIKVVSFLKDKELIYAKNILAFEATLIVHGKLEALKVYQATSSLFGLKTIPSNILPSSSIPRSLVNLDNSLIPQINMNLKLFLKGIPAFKLFKDVGLVDSTSFARRLIKQGGGYINGKRVLKFDYIVNTIDIKNKEILLRAGKKKFVMVKVLSDTLI